MTSARINLYFLWRETHTNTGLHVVCTKIRTYTTPYKFACRHKMCTVLCVHTHTNTQAQTHTHTHTQTEGERRRQREQP